MFLADLHLHSNFSDGKLSIPQLVDMYGKLGFGAIAITDHLCESKTFLGEGAKILNRTLTLENYPLYLDLIKSEAERAWDKYKMLVIPGFEITKNYFSNSRSAHMLAINVNEFISANGDIADIADRIRDAGGFSVAAHPVSTRKLEKQTYHIWDRREELSKKIDAWEVASGPFIFDEVEQSGLPMVANSDLHHPRQVFSWKTAFYCEKKPEAMFDAIRTFDVEFTFFNDEVARLMVPEFLGTQPASIDLRHLLNTG